jgi:hypothetical protein
MGSKHAISRSLQKQATGTAAMILETRLFGFSRTLKLALKLKSKQALTLGRLAAFSDYVLTSFDS